MKRVINFLTNKYLLVLVVAGVWIVFFDNYNLRAQYKMKRKIERLEQDRTYYQSMIEDLDYERERLYNDAEEMERFARERYYMKRSNEDVFVIVEE